MQNPGYDGFIWFIGIVEDINDPKKLGRVRVRMINEYSNRVQTDDIPWAIVLAPTTSAAFMGVGASPLGMTVGSRVLGFFLDGMHKSKPVVIGTMPIINRGQESEHSLSEQARGIGPVSKEYTDNEPYSQYAAEYPYNKTINTLSGHVVELDDTPSAERIHVYHKSGSYVEINPDGTIVTKSSSDSVEVVIQDKIITVESGDMVIQAVNGTINILSKGSIVINSESDISIEAPMVSING